MLSNFRVAESGENVSVDWCSIFNTYRYFDLHKKGGSCYFSLLDDSSGLIVGVCHFTETEKGIFRSPHRGTFGGFELKESNIEQLIFFINKAQEFLKQKGAKKIIVSTPPFQYNTSFSSQLFNTLFNENFVIDAQEIDYAVPVDDTNLIEKMNHNNKKRLKKCQREGFQFEQVFDETQFKNVYEIIACNRKHKGYQMSMTYDQILEMKLLFPDSIYFFKVSRDNMDIASSICIKVNNQVLYVFYWGDIPGYEQYSPISFVADGIYQFSRKNNFKLLDAGTANLKGAPLLGLMKFKENLGFKESLKLTYIKNL